MADTNPATSTFGAIEFIKTLESFAKDSLSGILEVNADGYSHGNVHLKLPVVSYLMRLLYDAAEDDEIVVLNVHLGEKLVIESSFNDLSDHEHTALIVKIASYAGFDVSRNKNTLIFTAEILHAGALPIYAMHCDEFTNMLKEAFEM